MAKIPLEDINGSDDNFSLFVTDSEGNPMYLDRPDYPSVVTVGPEGFGFVRTERIEDNSKRILNVVQDGQTEFNLGMSERRTKLWLNGIPQEETFDYTINLPLLTWVAPYPLSTTDFFYLTHN
jgi:hypothetical protein